MLQSHISHHEKFVQRRLMISGVLTILNDLLNLGEQFAVFAQIKDNNSRRFHRRFLLFICGIATFNLIKYFFTNRRVRIAIGFLSDSFEFAVYCAMLERTRRLFIITTIFTSFELLLHLVNFVVTGPTEGTRGKYFKCIDLGVQLVVAVVCNGIPYLTLFVKGNTQFHEDYFEYLLILYVFMSNAGIEILSEISASFLRLLCSRKKQRPDFTELLADEPHVLKVYIWIKFAIGILINYVAMPIIIFVISVVELVSDPSTLDSYDRDTYIVLIVFMGVYFLLTPLFTGIFSSFIYFLYIDRRAKK